MIERLLLFGATGDLAGRFLLPALAELSVAGQLPDSFEVIGAARRKMTDDEYRRTAAARIEEFAPDIPPSARDDLLRRIRYRPIDLGAVEVAKEIRAILKEATGEERPVAAYLALPPNLFASAITALGDAGIPPGSRIVVEKPFGECLEDAVELNRLLSEVAGSMGEQAIFRVDHVLGMANVYNLVGLRLANRVLEPIWNSAHIEKVEVLWEETLALEGRAGFFDRTGALKDVMQNHMLQILALTAMEPPSSLSERELRDRKVDALRAVRSPTDARMTERTRRARYCGGRLSSAGGAHGGLVPDYAAEDGVDPDRRTETFAEVVLEIDNERWAGTLFVLRAGKALDRRWKGVILHFRPAERSPFGDDLVRPLRNELRIGLDGPEIVELRLIGASRGSPPQLLPLVLATKPPATHLYPYAQVLRDILGGDCALSVRGDEAEEAWRIMTPVLRAWAEDRVELEEYAAGSAGPAPRREDTERSPRPR